MPSITLKTSKKVTDEVKKDLKSQFGKMISILPGKSESWLMVDIEDGRDMWFKGSDSPCAMVEICLFGSSSPENYEKLTAAVSSAVSSDLGISEDRIYVRYEETEYWGWNGGNF